MNLQIFSEFFGQGKVLFWAFLVREVDFSNVFNCLGLRGLDSMDDRVK